MKINKPFQLLLTAAVLATPGCCSPYFGYPHPFRPTTAELQQSRAQRFDPYPDPDIGPPVVGGRPRDYDLPLDEQKQAHWVR